MKTNDKTVELYGSQSFDKLFALGCVDVYEEHIRMLEVTLNEQNDIGNYQQCYVIQKAQDHFRLLIKQALQRRTNVGK